MEIREYVAPDGRSPYGRWFDGLDVQAAAKVSTAIVRMEHGNLSNAKSLGGGLFENRIDSGPGYRVYFGRDGEVLIVLLGGGTKRRQQRDIDVARTLWQEYGKRKRGNT